MTGGLLVDAVADDLGVGVRSELVAGRLERGAQHGVVLDNAVVHEGQVIRGQMRMRVALVRHPVGRPAGVGHARVTVQRALLEHLLKGFHPADGTSAHQPAVLIKHGDTGGVVTAIFETPQAFEQQGDNVALGDGADDAAHGVLLRVVTGSVTPIRRRSGQDRVRLL